MDLGTVGYTISEETMHKFFSVLAAAVVATTIPAMAGHHDRSTARSDRPAHQHRAAAPARVYRAPQPERAYRVPRHEQAYRNTRPVRVYRAAQVPLERAPERIYRVMRPAYPERTGHAARMPERFSRSTPFVRTMMPIRRNLIVRHETIVRAAPFEQVVPSHRIERRGGRDSFVQTVYVTRPNEGAVYQRWVRQARDYDRWMHRAPRRHVAYRNVAYNYTYYNTYENTGYRRYHRDSEDDDDDNRNWNGYYDNAVYNSGYYDNWNAGNWPAYGNDYNNSSGYYNNGYYDPSAYYDGYPYPSASPSYDSGLGTIGTIVSLAQLAGVNLGDLGQLADLTTLGGNYYGSGYPLSSYAAPAYYGGYANPYSPQHLSGLVVSDNGSQMIVMTPNFTPVAVNDAPAYQLGYVPRTIQTGTMVDAVGYYDGSTFVATAVQ
ncbi:MAG: hypothetical protein ACXVAO_09035 [Vulcanimicrobiaceae bacterium]